jgi:hypothetical protein
MTTIHIIAFFICTSSSSYDLGEHYATMIAFSMNSLPITFEIISMFLALASSVPGQGLVQALLNYTFRIDIISASLQDFSPSPCIVNRRGG